MFQGKEGMEMKKWLDKLNGIIFTSVFVASIGMTCNASAEYKYLTLTKEYGINSNLNKSLKAGDDYEKRRVPEKCPGLKVKNASDDILEVQREVAQLNNLAIVDHFFDYWDFRSKVTPVKMVEGYNNSFALGNGKIYLGSKDLEENGYYNGDYFGYGSAMALIAHETGHIVLNHGTYSNHWSKKLKEKNEIAGEMDADGYAINTMEKSSKFGWYGVVTMRNGNGNIGPHINTEESLEDYLYKQTKGKLMLWYKPYSEGFDLHIKDNGKYGENIDYKLLADDFRVNYHVRIHDYKMRPKYENALCQLGFVYSKKHYIDKYKLVLEPNNAYGIHQKWGKYRLVYRDSSMPNGYKVIAYFDSDIKKLKETRSKDYHTQLEIITNEKDNDIAEEEALLFIIDKFGVDLFNS